MQCGTAIEFQEHLDSYPHYKNQAAAAAAAEAAASPPQTPPPPGADSGSESEEESEDPEYAGLTTDVIFQRAVEKKLTSKNAVESMKSNIRDGTFTEEHYRKLWIGRLSGKTPKKAAPRAEDLPQWHCEKVLGQGGFGMVFMAQSPEGTPAVVKSPIAASHQHETVHESAVSAPKWD